MAENIVSVPLPADLPENWTDNQYVTPGGTEAGLSEQHGFNYLMRQVNNAQKAAKELSADVSRSAADLTAPGWYRVARCTEEHSSSFDLAVGTVWHTNSPTSCVVTVGKYSDGVNLAQKLIVALGVISRMRIVYASLSSNEYYVEVYSDSTTLNRVQATVRNFAHVMNDSIVEAVDFEPGSVPSGYTSKEFKLVYTSGSIVMDAEVG